ncbi:hypothetical protein HNQ80_002492 [Anaerosolibacter carboniphilus]|uniref:Uncharacterized protein n=1 Tax=Anaerosolibacter carboniphilus TaxID=1417629 RepID=A0A841KZQ3_9FIRM|nr:hypothetical protein [Anaerosolibacter carboniphilus]MBB6216392.1 hypothetical protein [Anaerosolibacter carboniphilus]
MTEPKKRYNELMVVVLTVITVLGIWSMRPAEERLLPELNTGYRPNGSLEDKTPLETRLDIYFDDILNLDQEGSQYQMIIDDATLDKFIYVYHDKLRKSPAPIEITFERKEEVRSVLENMGTINLVHLKEVLSQEVSSGTVEEVEEILQENLFEQELEHLDNLIIPKQ